jgi:ubiquinone/menaquinone biosynthesis C-methylase UbiE
MAGERYVTAAGRIGSTRLYDRTVRLTMREDRWRTPLVGRLLAGVPDGGRVLDVGAGTGTLALALAAARPGVEVVAVDGDPDALALARAKPGAERVTWAEGLADALPMADGGVDAAVFSLVLHHLGPATQRRALAEAARALRPGGRLLVADWGRPDGLLTGASFLLLRAIDGFAATRAHARGELPTLIGAAGFSPVLRLARLRTGWGALELLEATRR